MPIPTSCTLFSDFLHCRYKAGLRLSGQTGNPSDFTKLDNDLSNDYRKRAETHLLNAYSTASVCVAPISLPLAISQGHDLITNAVAVVDNLTVHIDAIIRIDPSFSPAKIEYAPVLYFRSGKLTSFAKQRLALSGVILERLIGKPVRLGRIIHGPTHVQTTVRLENLIPEATTILQTIDTLLNPATAPILRLNSHCPICEFRDHCHSIAVQKDDLSLLRGCKEKDIKSLNKKGIFTVTQLSYTFRPRRRRHLADRKQTPKYHAPLQALAIRTNTVYVAGTPALAESATRIYLDIEGIPERNFYYLFGILICNAETQQYHSFWADDESEEAAAWNSFLTTLKGYSAFSIFHYGSYDSRWFTVMRKRHGGDPALLDTIQATMTNVLSSLYSRVYFPTFANDLKSIATYLGFHWSNSSASGLQSIVWRHRWERMRLDSDKAELLRYNNDDCLALKLISEALVSIAHQGECVIKGTSAAVINANEIKRDNPHRLGRNPFFFSDLEWINRCAYFDYQRERVFVRTNDRIRRSERKKAQGAKKAAGKHLSVIGTLKVNQVVVCPRPIECPACSGPRIHRHGSVPASKTVFDLRLLKGGVKRWIVRYMSHRYTCPRCNKAFYSPAYTALNPSHFGSTLRAWCVFNNIAQRQSHGLISDGLRSFFGYSFSQSLPSDFKKEAAAYYKGTIRAILEALLAGTLIHVDETKVSIKGRVGYVWAFASLDEVLYVFKPSREGDWLKEFLKTFQGVLVSDFYTAYDSVDCIHQRCLIHLMRDINDDLFKNPFDNDMKLIGRWFTATLRPIVETIDRFGLKKRHLSKHKPLAERFVDNVLAGNFSSDVAIGYQRRIRKYRDKLFTFLCHDGIPWNNNNAEHAIKRFAFLRNVVGGSSTEAGMEEYLVLLSVYETLRLRGIEFLPFLISGETNIDGFCGGRSDPNGTR